ncbi:Hypothetical predicted protein [Mytilus galloprovincialis]|uniref:Uncharacterized protein n=1 Tax=Mytilus galloprovincialis TaxID=29158 RepID=A0A8B6GV31_MYTGA|nr:Hypothetical predicted protein [Mytilus galloprovincialis]
MSEQISEMGILKQLLALTGPPVFAKENIYVNHGKVRQSSIKMSFLVYSCPDVVEIFLQKLGRMRGKKRKLHKYVLKSKLLYNEFDNNTGVPGYNICIEIQDLNMDILEPYCITVTNRLDASEYYFAKNSYGAVSNVRPSDTHDNPGHNLTHLHAANISNEVNVQSTDGNSTELNADFPNDDLPPPEVPDTNFINEGQSSEQNNQTSDDSDNELSQTVMVGNAGDGYENPYQTVLQDYQDSHKYTQITIERNINIVSDSDCEMQVLENSLTNGGGYNNFQF